MSRNDASQQDDKKLVAARLSGTTRRLLDGALAALPREISKSAMIEVFIRLGYQVVGNDGMTIGRLAYELEREGWQQPPDRQAEKAFNAAVERAADAVRELNRGR